ncbi:restriction endonuclease subunit S [Thiolapillus sp.]|uniref:restriction endonuclease subunit S n=6 Tax=Thiolapillus sp. TaxID=2017437 RepID=UPI003AF9395A
MGGEWVEVRIKDIVTVVGGSTPSTKDALNFGGDIPWLTPKDLSGTHPRYVSRGNRNLSLKGLHRCSATLLPKNTVLLTTRAPIGYVALSANPIATNQGFRSLIVKPEFDHEFLYYWLKVNKTKLERHASGSTFKELSGTALKNIAIRLPTSKAEQRAIAHILGSLDDKIELNRQMAQTLESIARAIFKSWFVDFDPVVVNALRAGNSIPDKFTKRAARYRDNPDELSLSEEIQCQFPDRFQDSELGPIPERWEIGPLKQIASLSTKTIQPKNDPLKLWVHYSIPAYDDGKMPKTEQGQTIMSGKYLVPKHAVLASKLNPQFPRVWLPMQDGIEDSICSTEFMPFIPRDSDERNLLYMFFLSDVAQREITNRVTGSTGSRQRVRPKDIEQMNILIPEKRLRIIYSDLTNGLIGLSLEKQDESATLANIRDTLLPKLISGELRIKDFERFLGKVA